MKEYRIVLAVDNCQSSVLLWVKAINEEQATNLALTEYTTKYQSSFKSTATIISIKEEIDNG
jgi:hypothetical protein